MLSMRLKSLRGHAVNTIFAENLYIKSEYQRLQKKFISSSLQVANTVRLGCCKKLGAEIIMPFPGQNMLRDKILSRKKKWILQCLYITYNRFLNKNMSKLGICERHTAFT